MTDIEAAREWLTWLYGERPDGLLWIGGHGDGFRGRTFTSIDDAVAYAAELDARGGEMNGVYHRLTTMRPVASGRGAAADSAYLPAFAMDLDLRGPGHKSDRYPETAAQLEQLLRKAGLPEPSAWVHSGGGRYPFWKLEQPVDLTLPGQLDSAWRTSQELHRLVIDWANDNGWKVDNTSDLARIYRLPGTMNRKPGVAPVPAAVASPHAGDRYSLAEVAGHVATAPRPRPVDPGPPQLPAAKAAKSGEAGQRASSLFGGGGWPDDERSFTVGEAMVFVAPALEALRTAADGEINVRLNEAALRLAHFGPEFWSREAAEKQLYDALDHTAYDGRTWKAADTIASGWRAGEGDWRAELRPEAPTEQALSDAVEQVEPDAVEALLAEMLDPEQLELLPPPRPLIEGVMSLDSEVWLIGPAGSKKSFVVLDMARAVSTGSPWQGRDVHQGLVVIIAAEGAAGIGKRIKALRKRHGALGQIKVLPRPVQAKDVGAWGVLVKACAQLQPAMVVVDTQARVTVGLEENSATDMGYYIAAVGALRRATGAGIVTLHHTGRKGGDARGSSALDGAQDTELTIVPGEDKLRATLKVTKQKDLEEGDPIELRFVIETVGVDEKGRDVTSLAVLPHDAWSGQEATWEAVETGQTVTIPEPAAGDWTYRIFEHHRQYVSRYILATLAEITTPDAGVTEAQAQKAVRDRWYEGKPLASKRKGHLSVATWAASWAAARTTEDGALGERVLLQNGERWSVNPNVNRFVTGQ